MVKRSWLSALAVLACAVLTHGETINLEWRPAIQQACEGDLVSLELYAVSGDKLTPELVAVELFITWEPEALEFVGVDDAGAVPSSFAGFIPGGPCDPNETIPPQDGDGRYNWVSNPADPVYVDSGGVLLGTFQFYVLADLDLPTDVMMIDVFKTGDEVCESRIASGISADVLGSVDVVSVYPAIFCSAK